MNNIVEYWKAQNRLKINEGLSLDFLMDFEVRHTIKIPRSYAEYLIEANGYAISDDWEGVSHEVVQFYPLEEK